MKELLPIGSVVLLKEGKKKVMIIGVKQMDSETSVEYDYLTVLYPEGFIANAGMFFCNHDAIDEIYHGKVKIIAEVPAEEVEEAVTEEVTVEE